MASVPVLVPFEYSSKDYLFDVSWDNFDLGSKVVSKFDLAVTQKWEESMKKGHFRYTLDKVKTRTVPGKYGYVLQLNALRATERRSAQNIHSMHMPFDPTKFNFTDVNPAEILFELQNTDKPSCNGIDKNSPDSCGKNIVLINVSPLEYGHILVVPSVDDRLPQLLTLNSLRVGLTVLLLSAHPGWRLGFNSLCAFASVNHLHMHAWYLEHRLYLETSPVVLLCQDVYLLTDYPSKGFAFQLHNLNVESMARLIFHIVKFFHSHNIAYNFFMTRGCAFDGSGTPTIRAILFPRKSVIGRKPDSLATVDVFNIAVCELAGHLPTYIEAMFDEITEEYIVERIHQQMFSDEEFSSLTSDVKQMLLESCDSTNCTLKMK